MDVSNALRDLVAANLLEADKLDRGIAPELIVSAKAVRAFGPAVVDEIAKRAQAGEELAKHLDIDPASELGQKLVEAVAGFVGDLAGTVQGVVEEFVRGGESRAAGIRARARCLREQAETMRKLAQEADEASRPPEVLTVEETAELVPLDPAVLAAMSDGD